MPRASPTHPGWTPAEPLHPDGLRLDDGGGGASGQYLAFSCSGDESVCHTHRAVGIAQAIERFGPAIRKRELERRLRCGICGNRNIRMSLAVDAGAADYRARRGPIPQVTARWPDDLEDVWEDYMCNLYSIPFDRRRDGLIAVTIDSNVWNLFAHTKVDLAIELPGDRFKIYIPREVEIEIEAIPDSPDKAALKAYIADQIISAPVETTQMFGFSNGGQGPERHGGFGVGVWQPPSERKFYDLVRPRFLHGKKQTRSQLSKNEADAALGAKSFSSIVLTKDMKPGPLLFASKIGGKVLDMRQFQGQGAVLASWIVTFYCAP